MLERSGRYSGEWRTNWIDPIWLPSGRAFSCRYRRHRSKRRAGSRGIDGSAARHVHQLGSLASFAFVVCGALRLARFNLQAKSDTSSKRYFVGLPIPAAATMIAAVVHFFKTPTLMVGSALLWSFLILFMSFLMISTVRYYSFKAFDVNKARPSRP